MRREGNGDGVGKGASYGGGNDNNDGGGGNGYWGRQNSMRTKRPMNTEEIMRLTNARKFFFEISHQ